MVNISSFAGQTGRIGQPSYTAARAWFFGFTKALARETATKGIAVNCVVPGAIKTGMAQCSQRISCRRSFIPSQCTPWARRKM